MAQNEMAIKAELKPSTYQFGTETADHIASALNAIKIGKNSNEFKYLDKTIAIKCAKKATNSVGVTHKMLDRIDSVLGAFETSKHQEYKVYEITTDQYKRLMYGTKSKQNINKVSEVRKSDFKKYGRYIATIPVSSKLEIAMLINKPEKFSTIQEKCDLNNLIRWCGNEISVLNEESYKRVLIEIVNNLELYVKWPKYAELLWKGCHRINDTDKKQKYHQFPDELKIMAAVQKVNLDNRSNGPAIASFQVAGGVRPYRLSGNNQWSIHHIYNSKFPYLDKKNTIHAVKDGKHFTQSAGLVAIHPVLDQAADEYPCISWLLRAISYLKFGYDPDQVFDQTNHDEYGFAEGYKTVVRYSG